MLTKELVLGSIEILEDARMQVREDTIVKEDGKELSRTFQRYVVNPGDDVSQRPQRVRDLATLLWTCEAVDAWKAREAKLRAAMKEM